MLLLGFTGMNSRKVHFLCATCHYLLHSNFRLMNFLQRFLPTEFGNDVDRVHPVEPARSLMFGAKAQIRRAVEGEGIPYTFVAANFSTGRFLPTLAQVEVGVTGLPTDKVLIVGDGNVKGKRNYDRFRILNLMPLYTEK